MEAHGLRFGHEGAFLSRRKVDADAPFASSTLVLPDFFVRPRMPCFTTGGPMVARMNAMPVEMLIRFRLPPPVPQQSSSGFPLHAPRSGGSMARGSRASAQAASLLASRPAAPGLVVKERHAVTTLAKSASYKTVCLFVCLLL
jgi:hypothetical protein